MLQVRLDSILNRVVQKAMPWVTEDGRVLDPIDDRENPEHYAETHLAVSMLILGKHFDDAELSGYGFKILEAYLSRLDVLPYHEEFHNDFNLFALTIAHDLIERTHLALAERIRIAVCEIADSRHNTINWLPMRAYVNRRRFDWTREKRYEKEAQRLSRTVVSAVNEDGGIEDALPRGQSYNLQYNISTLAGICFSRELHEDIDVSKCFHFIADKQLPDGDVNYQGRGVNQIFAYGPWLYLLARSSQEAILTKTLDFVEEKWLQRGLPDDNLLMRSKNMTAEKYLWWDYHHYSVYLSHFLMWLALARVSEADLIFENREVKSTESTGLKSYSDNAFRVVSFVGRKRYLAEAGPAIMAIFHNDIGGIVKSSFGPWKGRFGNKNSYPAAVMLNHFGLYQLRSHGSATQIWARIADKLGWGRGVAKQFTIEPTLSEPSLTSDAAKKQIKISFDNSEKKRVFMNAPIMESQQAKLTLSFCDTQGELPFARVGKLEGQYGAMDLYQSAETRDVEVSVIIQILD